MAGAVTTALALLVAERLRHVRERIDAAGGDVSRVKIVAVTKGFGPEAVAAAHAAGCHDIGENYAGDLEAKASAASRLEPRIVWHYLGAVQRRKVKTLAPCVDFWHGVDRMEEAAEIARHRPDAAVLVQVKLTGAAGQGGCPPEEAPALVGGLRDLGVDVRGLMGIAGRHDPRKDFARLARLASSLGVDELSMGMSGDFEAAVAEGSTMVRIGTALFGARPGAQ